MTLTCGFLLFKKTIKKYTRRLKSFTSGLNGAAKHDLVSPTSTTQ